MDFDLTLIIELLKKLLLLIFKTYEVDKEFEALGIDIEALLSGAAAPTEPTEG